MSASVKQPGASEAPVSQSFLKLAGPGLIVAASGIGSGDVVSATVSGALIFITLVPMPFAFLGRPLLIIVTYTIVGGLFIPFLAATLLYLNNRVHWTAPVPRNHWTTNTLLIVILAMFLIVGAQEIVNAL